MKNDSATDLVAARLAQAMRDYVPRHPTKFRKLLPMKGSIAELRSKGASYAVIAEILRNINVPVASDTIFRFCHEVLGEPMTRRRRRRKVAAIVPKERAREKSRTENARDIGNLQGKSDSQPAAGWVRSTGPRIADPNTI
jgi:hypothetical protein